MQPFPEPLYREGLGGTQSPDDLKKMLEEAGKERTKEARGAAPRLDHIVPHTVEDAAKVAPPRTLFREGTEYYRTSRAQHPNSPNWYVFRSLDQLASFSAFDHVDLISPHPLLLIAGTDADTLYFSEIAYKKAKEPKELFLIDGATHIDLYDKEQYVGPAVKKLDNFFTQYLSGN
ncbi:hypothetical protein K7432_012691 [Basidiobolus ranarum]|uniref:Uncharacterized protein n=1 Tax=Basidiobolus ranarum TaxID=34480 RepID=A0ABR2VRW1_9FUNG